MSDKNIEKLAYEIRSVIFNTPDEEEKLKAVESLVNEYTKELNDKNLKKVLDAMEHVYHFGNRAIALGTENKSILKENELLKAQLAERTGGFGSTREVER